MPRLNRLNHSLLRSVSRAALGAEAPAEDEDDVAEGDEEETPPAGKSRRSKKAGKGKSRAEEQDDDSAEGEDEDDTAEGEDDDPDAEDDLDPDAEDDDESAEGDEDEDAEGEDEDDTAEGDDEEEAEDDEEDPPAGRRGRKSRKSKAPAKGGRTVNSGERARIAAITRSKLAAGREDLADFLAFDTGLSSRTALAILKHAPKARTATTLRSRMAAVENPRIKQGPGKGPTTDDEQVVVAAAAKTLKSFGF